MDKINTGIKGVSQESESTLPTQDETPSPSPVSPRDPQIKATRPYTPRRSYSKAYKERILSAYHACPDAVARGALLRKEGLYHSRISAWKQQQAKVKFGNTAIKSNLKDAHLSHENTQLKKKLAQAEAVIELQKKVSELLGTYILPHEMNGES